jgi:arabinogalactan endo-1,4-beta-galactosidase
MWPDGKGNWNNQADLIKAGIRGVDQGRGGAPMPSVMLHVACGGDTTATKSFFDNADKSGIAYDVIGQSYYPLWHGTPADLERNLGFMAGRYAKDIMVVETAFSPYPDGGSPFPLTDAGQVDYLREIDRMVRATPEGRGKGWMWWEPTGDEYLGTPRGLFDLQLNAKPALALFDGRVSLGRPGAARARLGPSKSAHGDPISGRWTGIRFGLPQSKENPEAGYRFYTPLGQGLPGL